MKPRHLLLALGLSACMAGAQASSINVTASYQFPGGYTVQTGALNTTTPDVYYELVNPTQADLNTLVTLVTSNPTGQKVGYGVYQDTNPATGTGTNVAQKGALVTSGTYLDDISDTTFPFFSFLMHAGQQYVLELSRAGTNLNGVTTQINAVPLPGAIWLFGSALLGFLGFSSRRKI